MFHPENKLRASWDFFVLATTVFAAIEIRSSSDSTLANYGAIEAEGDAVSITNAANVTNHGRITSSAAHGVVLLGSGTLTNNGEITAQDEGVVVDAGASVINRGTITSAAASGVLLDGTGDLTNEDTISA